MVTISGTSLCTSGITGQYTYLGETAGRPSYASADKSKFLYFLSSNKSWVIGGTLGLDGGNTYASVDSNAANASEIVETWNEKCSGNWTSSAIYVSTPAPTGSCMEVGVCNSSTDGSSCTSAASCSTGVCNGMATCQPPNTLARCSDDADCWGNGTCTDSNNGASCSPGAAVTDCTGQGQCIRDNIALVTLVGNPNNIDLYNVPNGAKPFVTDIMRIKWDLAASSPVPGAYSQYLVVFRLESFSALGGVQVPPGSKLIVTGLTAASASSTLALYKPRDNCDEKQDISSFFAHEQQVGYAQWNYVNKSVTLTLREGYNTGLVHNPSKHAFRFTARSQDLVYICACTCI